MRRTTFFATLGLVFVTRAALAADPPPLPEPLKSPTVDDPMLVPIAPPARTLATWNDVAGYVRARSTDLHIAQAEIARADAQSRIAIGALLGTINGNAGATVNFLTNTTALVSGLDANLQPIFRTITTPIPTYATASLVLGLPIVAPRAWNSVRTAGIGQDVAAANLEETKRLLLQNVAASVVAVVTAERVAELNRNGLRSALERLDLAQRRRALEAGTSLDMIRAQQDVEAARATLVTGDESLRQSRESLGLALGMPEPIGVDSHLNLDGVVDDLMKQCKIAPGADARSDVELAKERVLFAHQTVTDAKMQFFPTLSAQSTLFTTTQDLGATPSTQWNIQGVLSWAIWDGGVRYGALRDGRAQEDQAVQRLEATRRGAIIQITQADRAVQVADVSRAVASRSRDLAVEQDRLTRSAYQLGTGTSLELVTSAAALRQADISLALREFALVRARLLAILNRATCPI
ncbi:efflux transporter outer membrane subunit [soil metagenome]